MVSLTPNVSGWESDVRITNPYDNEVIPYGENTFSWTSPFSGPNAKVSWNIRQDGQGIVYSGSEEPASGSVTRDITFEGSFTVNIYIYEEVCYYQFGIPFCVDRWNIRDADTHSWDLEPLNPPEGQIVDLRVNAGDTSSTPYKGEGLDIMLDIQNTGEEAGFFHTKTYLKSFYYSLGTGYDALKFSSSQVSIVQPSVASDTVEIGPGETKTLTIDLPPFFEATFTDAAYTTKTAKMALTAGDWEIDGFDLFIDDPSENNPIYHDLSYNQDHDVYVPIESLLGAETIFPLVYLDPEGIGYMENQITIYDFIKKYWNAPIQIYSDASGDEGMYYSRGISSITNLGLGIPNPQLSYIQGDYDFSSGETSDDTFNGVAELAYSTMYPDTNYIGYWDRSQADADVNNGFDILFSFHSETHWDQNGKKVIGWANAGGNMLLTSYGNTNNDFADIEYYHEIKAANTFIHEFIHLLGGEHIDNYDYGYLMSNSTTDWFGNCDGIDITQNVDGKYNINFNYFCMAQSTYDLITDGQFEFFRT